MKTAATIIILFSVLLSDVHSYSVADSPEYRKGHALLEAINRCTIVVVGTVVGIEGMWRGSITTDITIDIETLIKGKPNVSNTRLKFMIGGGICLNPRRGKISRMLVGGQPEFEIGERVFLFLKDGEKGSYYENIPYDRCRVYSDYYGKRKIEGNKIKLAYPENDPEFSSDMTVLEFPVALAVHLGKAFVRDKESALELEEELKTLARTKNNNNPEIPQQLVDRLISESKKILEKEREGNE